MSPTTSPTPRCLGPRATVTRELTWNRPPLPPCNGCRKRKKRCYHVPAVEKSYPPIRDNTESDAVPTSVVHSRDSSPSLGRVSLYNPESVFVDLSMSPAAVAPASASAAAAAKTITTLTAPTAAGTTTTTTTTTTTPTKASLPASGATHAHLGRIITASPDPNPASVEENAQRQLLWYNRHRQRLVPLNLSDHHRRYLEAEGAFLRLPKSTTDSLLPIYNTFLDELIPLLDGRAMFRDYSNGLASIYLVRAVCLVACKTRQATASLRLYDDGPTLSQDRFAASLLAGLDAAIKADLEPDRVTKVQILALMHLHNDGPGGVDRSSSYLAQAICEAWSISLHVKVPVNADQEQCDLLWWALRNFDRLNKPVMGAAPFIIDDTDIGIDRTSPYRGGGRCYTSQLMAVSLRLGDLTTAATKVYKASSEATVDDKTEFPTFAELTSDVAPDRFNKSHRSYLQLWYHVAAMLSCRYSGPGSVQYARRLTSADCVLGIISQAGPDGLPPLPLVPYAMSMSTTVIYRALRDGERRPEVAYKDLEQCSHNLDVLSQLWSSAKGVAKLVRRLRRYTTPDTLSRRPSEPNATNRTSGSPRRGSREQRPSPSGRGTPMSGARHRDRGFGGLLQPPVLPMSGSSPDRDILEREDGRDNNGVLQSQHDETWMDTHTPPYLEIDRAFYDFFDYGMPSIFRDPATLDVVQGLGDGYQGTLPS